MLVGSIGYACRSGLGHLLRDFYRNGVVNRVLIIPHPHYEHRNEWYKPEDSFARLNYKRFLEDLTHLLIFENAFDWALVKEAKNRGVKIAIMPMYEYSPFPPPVPPDLVICPSLLDVQYYQRFNHVFLNVPVDKPWRLRAVANTFFHNAGHGQYGYAKGTREVVEAMQFVESPITLHVRAQPDDARITSLIKNLETRKFKNVMFDVRQLAEEELFTGDVYVNAEQFNGLSLPLQEAHASGMLVITTDRFPANTWLPKEPLMPTSRLERHRIATTFDRVYVDPRTIATALDSWYNKDITYYSNLGREWAVRNSWSVLKPKYLEALSSL